MRLTAKEAADRLGVSYVVAAGIMSHLEEVGKAKVVEKKFHASGKGKPTRVYEVDAHTVIDFGVDKVVDVRIKSLEPGDLRGVPVVEKNEEGEAVGVKWTRPEAPVVVEAPVEVEEKKVEKIETLDHVAAALARLKADNAA